MAPFGQNLASLRSAIESFEYLKTFKMVLIIPFKHNKIPLLRFTIPLFHHSIIPVWNLQDIGQGFPIINNLQNFPIS
jgi:hypothetical protein